MKSSPTHGQFDWPQPSGDDAYLQHHWMPYGPGHNSVFLVCCALWGGEKAEAYKYVQAGLFKNVWKILGSTDSCFS